MATLDCALSPSVKSVRHAVAPDPLDMGYIVTSGPMDNDDSDVMLLSENFAGTLESLPAAEPALTEAEPRRHERRSE